MPQHSPATLPCFVMLLLRCSQLVCCTSSAAAYINATHQQLAPSLHCFGCCLLLLLLVVAAAAAYINATHQQLEPSLHCFTALPGTKVEL